MKKCGSQSLTCNNYFFWQETKTKIYVTVPETLPPLTTKPDKKKIKAAKYLVNLLHFVPLVHHEFYRSLKHEGKQQPQSKEKRKTRAQDKDDSEEEECVTSEEEPDNVFETDSD